MRIPLQLPVFALAVAALGRIPAFAQAAADEQLIDANRNPFSEFVDGHMVLAFAIVALVSFAAGAVLSHLRNK